MTPQWLAKVLAEHDYAINDFGSAAQRDGKNLPGGAPDPGWHGCRCGRWAGYWCDFRAHVAAVVWAEFTARAQQAREDVARSVRGTVRVGPFGPNSQAVNLAGGSVSLTPDEARDAADAAVAALLRAMGGAQ